MATLVMTSCTTPPTDEPNEAAQWYIGQHVSDVQRKWGKGQAEPSGAGYRRIHWDVGFGLGTCHVMAVVNHLGRIEAITAEQEGPNRRACAEVFVHLPLQP
jgi:hypothetical protein